VIIPVLGISSTIQPPTQDALMNGMFPGLNYGDDASIIVKAASPTESYRGLVQFDLSAIPAGSTISSATLKLYYHRWGTNDPVGRTLWAYRVTQSWTEGDGTTNSGVSWARYDGTNSWATPGGDYTTNGGASSTVPSSYGWMTWTVTDIVKAWVEDSEANCGFLIKDGTEDTAGQGWYLTYFYSSEFENTELQPILEIDYTPNSFVIPEFWFGTILGLTACFSALAVFLLHQRKHQ
jgi:hypothetical protein